MKEQKHTSLRIEKDLYEKAREVGLGNKWSTHQTIIEAIRIGVRILKEKQVERQGF